MRTARHRCAGLCTLTALHRTVKGSRWEGTGGSILRSEGTANNPLADNLEFVITNSSDVSTRFPQKEAKGLTIPVWVFPFFQSDLFS